MREDDLIVDNSAEKNFAKKKRRKQGFIWILVGVSCYIVKRIIGLVSFSFMMANGISSNTFWFMFESLFMPAVMALCFTIGLVLIFFDLEKVKAAAQKLATVTV